MGKEGLWFASTRSCPVQSGADTIHFFGGGEERKFTQYSELASDYNLSFNFLKLSGKSIEGCTAFGQCQKWQMGSGRVCGDGGGCSQRAWKCWHKLQDMERGVLPVLAYVLKVQDEGDGLCMVGTVGPEPSREGMNYSAAEWSEQHQTRGQEDITTERCEILGLDPRGWSTLGHCKESRPSLVCHEPLALLFNLVLKDRSMSLPDTAGQLEAQPEQCHVLKAAVWVRKQ